jgi:hypothetical protein
MSTVNVLLHGNDRLAVRNQPAISQHLATFEE